MKRFGYGWMIFVFTGAFLLSTTQPSRADVQISFEQMGTMVPVIPDGIAGLAPSEFAQGPAADHFTDGKFLRVKARQGQGLRLYVPNASLGDGKLLIELSVNVDGPGAMIAAALLDNQSAGDFTTLNGSGSFLIEMDSSLLPSGWQKFSTVYDPPRNGVVPLVQIVGQSDREVTVLIDDLKVTNLKEAYSRGDNLALLLGLATPPPQPTPTPTPIPIGSPEAKAVLARINQFRAFAGLRPLQMHQSLLEAAQAHSDYMALNNILDHAQDITLPGFTGARSWDRAGAAGYPTVYIWEDIGSVSIQISDPEDNVDLQMEGPFHRLPLLHAGLEHFGYGFARTGTIEYQTFNFGARANDPMEPVYYPGENQTDVPLSFGGYEFPDPFPGVFYPIGYPITLFVNQESDFKVLSYSLREVGGEPLSMTALLPGDQRENFDTSFMFAMASLSPLKPNTAYEARIEALVDGQTTSKTWRFTTKADASTASGKTAARTSDIRRAAPLEMPEN